MACVIRSVEAFATQTARFVSAASLAAVRCLASSKYVTACFATGGFGIFGSLYSSLGLSQFQSALRGKLAIGEE